MMSKKRSKKKEKDFLPLSKKEKKRKLYIYHGKRRDNFFFNFFFAIEKLLFYREITWFDLNMSWKNRYFFMLSSFYGIFLCVWNIYRFLLVLFIFKNNILHHTIVIFPFLISLCGRLATQKGNQGKKEAWNNRLYI